MGNATWACFNCHEAVRRPTHHREAVPCPQCGNNSVFLGTKIRIPPKDDQKAWEELRGFIREGRIAAQAQAVHDRVRRRHLIERQIADLESRPVNKGRTTAIRLLREELALL